MAFKYKQVLAVRTDLKMSKGKMAVQIAHAAVTVAEIAKKQHEGWWKGWMKEGQCKIAVKVDSKENLIRLKEKAEGLKLPNAVIIDRGLTQVPAGTITCLGIGPAPSKMIDMVTKSLPLL